MGLACRTCTVLEFPDYERLLRQVAPPAATPIVIVQAELVAAAVHAGYCARHAGWLGELVGWSMRMAAAQREVLAAAVRPGGR